VDFDIAIDKGKALLLSLNSAGVAYLLFTHKRHLSRKTISKVTIFADNRKKQLRLPLLVYYIVDALLLEGKENKGIVRRLDSSVDVQVNDLLRRS
jgi:hypothetical protein